MMSTQALEEARAMYADLKSSETLADLDQLYVNWVGHSVAEDDPTATFESVGAILNDYIREFCYATGTHCADVFGQ